MVVLTVTIDPDKPIVIGENDEKGIKTYPVTIKGVNRLLKLEQELFEGTRDLIIRMLHHCNSLKNDYQVLEITKQRRIRTEQQISDINISLKDVCQGEFWSIDYDDIPR